MNFTVSYMGSTKVVSFGVYSKLIHTFPTMCSYLMNVLDINLLYRLTHRLVMKISDFNSDLLGPNWIDNMKIISSVRFLPSRQKRITHLEGNDLRNFQLDVKCGI